MPTSAKWGIQFAVNYPLFSLITLAQFGSAHLDHRLRRLSLRL